MKAVILIQESWTRPQASGCLPHPPRSLTESQTPPVCRELSTRYMLTNALPTMSPVHIHGHLILCPHFAELHIEDQPN